MWLLVGWVMAWQIRVARAIWQRTTRILHTGLDPRYLHAEPDPLVERIAWWRAALGVGALATANIYWRGIDAGLLFGYANDWFNGVLTAAILVCLTAIIPATLLFCCAPPGSRRPLARYLWIPVRVPVYLALFGAALYGLTNVPNLQTSGLDDGARQAVGIVVGLLLIVVLWILLISLLAVFAVGLSLLVRYYGRAADGHPTLPALMAITLGLALGAVSALEWAELGPEPAFPLPVSIALAAGGPVSLVILGWWELHRHRRRGIGLRWSVVTRTGDVSRP